MKIGISSLMIQRGKTGIGQYLFALLKAMLTKAEEEQFVVFALEEDLQLFDFARERVELMRVAEQWRAPLKNIVWHQTQLPRLARELRLDVLHVPSYRRLLWPRPCPMVATIHDLAPFTVTRKYDLLRTAYARYFVPYLARRQDHVIAISETTARDLRHFFRVEPARLSVVYNGVDHEQFHPTDAAAQKIEVAKTFELTAPYFLYVARIEHPGKNHLRLIHAFNAFKAETGLDWQLVLAGSDWKGAEVVHEAAHKSRWSADIRFLGFVPDKQLPALYGAAEGFVFPSLFEGFGMPAIEAMACGCPVICGSAGALGEVVGEAALLLKDVTDEAEMTRRLVEVATGPELRLELRRKG
ncbi:MAG TPA: glycosyltransferase family 1 protein, partial [Verrucomicrobiae bacterium]